MSARLSRVAVTIVRGLAPEEWRESVIGDLTEELTRRRTAHQPAGVVWQMSAAIVSAGRLRAVAPRRPSTMPGARRRRFGSSLGFEMRQAFRALARRPTFAVLTMLTLTLGIGAGTAVFTLANWLVVRPVPGVARPGELVTIHLESGDGGAYAMNVKEYQAVAALPEIGAAAAAAEVAFHVSTGGGDPVRVSGGVVTSNYFSVLGQAMQRGRAFDAAQDDPGQASVAIVSDTFWRSALAADANVIGRRLTLNGNSFAVIGVAARGFHGPDRSGRADVWVPLASFRSSMPSFPATLLTRPIGLFRTILGRPPAGVPVATLNAALARMQSPLDARAHFVAKPGLEVPAWQRNGLRQMLGLLLGVAGLLLVLTAANVANMIFAHAHERAEELATRQALGASRAQVTRQLVLEGLILSFAGGAFSLAASAALGRWMDGLVISDNLPALSAVGLDWRVFLFATALSVVTCVAGSLAPAFLGSRIDLAAAIKTSGRSRMPAGRRVRRVLSIIQVAVAVALLAVGTLLVRSVLARYRVPLGYDADHVLAFSVENKLQGYSKDRTITYFRDALAGLRALPGVSSSGLAYIEPFREITGGISLTAQGRADAREVVGDTNMVTDGFFPALGVRFVGGRDFTPSEIFRSAEAGGGVLIVNQTMARALFGTDDATGRRVTAAFAEPHTFTIVGVIADIRTRDVGDARVAPTAYEPFGQSFLSGRGAFHVRITRPAAAMAAEVRDVMKRVDAQLPIYNVELVSESLDRHLAEPRLLAGTIESFAVLAAFVAALGLYGVLALGVEERRREFGIRAALGARPQRLAGLIAREGLVTAGTGGLIGVVGAIGLARLIHARLFGVQPSDPWSIGFAFVVAIAAAVVASALPALRAARLDVTAELRR